jgi:uncharacterized protein YggT (Ycf19 family)
MKQTLGMWLFKALEIVFVALLGYLLYLLITVIFVHFWAICGVSIIMYYFNGLIKPYVDEIRRWVYKQITGIDEEVFK